MPTSVRVFGLTKQFKRFVKSMTWTRQRREEQARQAASDVLDLLFGGVAAYLSDTHGGPKTDSDMLVLYQEQKTCILVALHAVLDKDARRFLTLGLIERLSLQTPAILLRSGQFEIAQPPTPRTAGEN